LKETMKKERIGIVIQGPLISRGRTGRTANIGFRSLTNEDIVDYNCIPLIVKMVERYSNKYDIICITWSNELESNKLELKRLLPPGTLYIIDDDTKYLPPRSKILSGNNKYRQIRSSLSGFEVLLNRGCTHLAKIRSDQEIDVDKLVYDYKNICNSSSILVPQLFPKDPHTLGDFYFMGESNLIVRLFKNYLNNPEYFKSIHLDLFYHWGHDLTGKSVWTFWPWLYSDYIRSVWLYLTPASRVLYENVIWRGEKLKINKNDKNFFYDDMHGRSTQDFVSDLGKLKLTAILIMGIIKFFKSVFNKIYPHTGTNHN
jgi:hypothetical protein